MTTCDIEKMTPQVQGLQRSDRRVHRALECDEKEEKACRTSEAEVVMQRNLNSAEQKIA